MRHIFLLALCASLSMMAPLARAQSSYDLWSTIDCGADVSAQGDFDLSGTIGQHDAGGILAADGFELSGGFWTIDAGGGCGTADFNCDGDIGTDADIEAFFACLAGNCPAPPCPNSADFNGDGDTGTDADIEAFFRVLAGGNC